MREPAQDRAVAADHLHPVDADIDVAVGFVVGRFGDHHRPGDERRRFVRPTDLDWQPGEVDGVSSPDDVMHGRRLDSLRAHGHDGTRQR